MKPPRRVGRPRLAPRVHRVTIALPHETHQRIAATRGNRSLAARIRELVQLGLDTEARAGLEPEGGAP